MGKSILIADSNPTLRESLALFLEEEGYSCQMAGDFSEVKKNLKKRLWDLVVMDVCLSGEKDFLLLKETRLFYPDTPVFILAPYEDYEEAARALNFGADRLIVKPVEFEELLDLARCLWPA